MRFMQLLLLENYEFCHRHYRSGLNFSYTHYLHHVLPVLFEKILKLMLEHRSNLAQLQSQLETLLKLKLFLRVL